MADAKIRGITIEFGADTTELVKGLKEVSSKINSTTKQLKDVERLLKLDPSNIKLWEQEQTLLATAIDDTAKKLEILKSAQDSLKESGVAQDSAKYMALEREIAATTAEMNNLKSKSQQTAQAIKDISTGKTVKALGDEKKAIKSVGDEHKKTNKQINTTAVNFNQIVSSAKHVVKTVKKVVNTFVDFVKSATDSAMSIKQLAQATGLAVSEIQKYQYAAEKLNITVEDLAAALANNENAIEQAAAGNQRFIDAFDTLGVSIYDAAGQLRNADDIFNDVREAINNLTTEEDKNAYTTELWGVSYKEIKPIIQSTREELEKIKNEASGLSTVTEEDVEKLNDLDSTLNNIGVSLVTLKDKFVALFSDSLGKKIDELNKKIKVFNVGLESLANGGLGKALTDDIVNPVKDGFQAAIDWIKKAWKDMCEWITNAWNNTIGALKGFFGGIGSKISNLWNNTFGDNGLNWFANGGSLTNGNAIVGEAGPELLSVSAGRATVTPLTNGASALAAPVVNIRFEGSLSELARILQPEIDAEYQRIGTSLMR